MEQFFILNKYKHTALSSGQIFLVTKKIIACISVKTRMVSVLV